MFMYVPATCTDKYGDRVYKATHKQAHSEVAPTISEGEIEVVLLVPLQLEGGGVHGEHSERGVAATLRSD